MYVKERVCPASFNTQGRTKKCSTAQYNILVWWGRSRSAIWHDEYKAVFRPQRR